MRKQILAPSEGNQHYRVSRKRRLAPREFSERQGLVSGIPRKVREEKTWGRQKAVTKGSQEVGGVMLTIRTQPHHGKPELLGGNRQRKFKAPDQHRGFYTLFFYPKES